MTAWQNACILQNDVNDNEKPKGKMMVTIMAGMMTQTGEGQRPTRAPLMSAWPSPCLVAIIVDPSSRTSSWPPSLLIMLYMSLGTTG